LCYQEQRMMRETLRVVGHLANSARSHDQSDIFLN